MLALTQKARGGSFRPREAREKERRDRICAALKAQGVNALNCAIAAVGTINDKTSRVNSLKQRVDSVMRRGPGVPDIRMFYANLSRLMRDRRVTTIDECLMHLAIEKLRTVEFEQFTGRALVLKHQTLAEATLAMRWLRRFRPDIDIQKLVTAMNRGPDHVPVVEIVSNRWGG